MLPGSSRRPASRPRRCCWTRPSGPRRPSMGPRLRRPRSSRRPRVGPARSRVPPARTRSSFARREAGEATEALWQEAERERVAVEGETRRLEALRRRTHEQLGRMYGHLESVLDEVRRGIGGAQVEEEAEPVTPEPAATRPAGTQATQPTVAEAKPAAAAGRKG